MATAPPRLYRTYLDGPAGQIHCRVAQPSSVTAFPPLLCLHMSPKSGWVFEPLLERLRKTRLVVAPDTPGFGMSDKPATPPEIGDYSDTLTTVIDRFDAGTAWDLLGYHTGSLIAMDMALRRPNRVRKLVLISVPLLSEAEIGRYASLGLGKNRAWDLSGEALLALWRLVLRWRMPGGSLSLCARSLADTLVAGDDGWWGHRAAFAFPVADALNKLQHPVAILNPGDDLWQATRRAPALCPDARYLEMPDWKHGFLHQVPDAALLTIGSLLDDTE